MATFIEKKYLDYNGLAKFWELIKGKFVASAEAESTTDSIVITLKDANGTAIGSPVTLDAATATQAGVMTAEQAKNLADLDQVLINGVPFKGLNIAGTKVNTDSTTAYANIGIALEKVDGVESIVLKDLSTGGTAISKIDVSQFVIDGILASSDVTMVNGKPILSLDFKLADGTTKSELIDLSSLVDVYTAGNGIDIADNVVSAKVKSGEKYLTVTADGIATTEQLVTDYTKAATDAQAAAEKTAKGYADAAQTAAEAKAAELASAAQAAGQAAAVQALTDAKAYTDTAIDNVNEVIGIKEGEGAPTGLYKDIADAEQNAKNHADAKIKEVVGEGGTLAGTLEAAKDYTDEKIDEVNDVIGTKAGTDGNPTGIYKDIADAQAAAAKAGTDAAAQALTDAKAYTDAEILKINDGTTGILAQAKKYTDDEIAVVIKTIEDNEKVTAESLTDLDDRVIALEAIDHNKILTDAQGYTEARLGDIPGNTTVKVYVDTAAQNGNTYADTAAKSVYDAMVRLTDTEITAIVNGIVAE